MQGQGDIFLARQRRQQVEELKDESDLVAANAGKTIVVELGEALPIQLDFSGGRMVKPSD